MKAPDEAKFTGPVKKGDEGPKAKLVQELLTLRGHGLVIDSEFGPASEAALKKFQKANVPSGATGIVDEYTWNVLWSPILDAISTTNAVFPMSAPPRSINEAIVAYANHHNHHNPHEVGGQNRGPWVRLYMAGKEGDDWPWCCGFVTYILAQAAEKLGKPPVFGREFSCTNLSKKADAAGRLIKQGAPASRIHAGDIFLVPKKDHPDCYQHTGIVESVDAANGVVHTLEGNTNDDGSREGYEVCERTRRIASLAFIRVGD